MGVSTSLPHGDLVDGLPWACRFEKKLTEKFGIFDVQKVEYLLFYQFVWPGCDIYVTRHFISHDDQYERSWPFLGTEKALAKDFEKFEKFRKC